MVGRRRGRGKVEGKTSSFWPTSHWNTQGWEINSKGNDNPHFDHKLWFWGYYPEKLISTSVDQDLPLQCIDLSPGDANAWHDHVNDPGHCQVWTHRDELTVRISHCSTQNCQMVSNFTCIGKMISKSQEALHRVWIGNLSQYFTPRMGVRREYYVYVLHPTKTAAIQRNQRSTHWV